jgi:CxxC motif-containing protein (DUF1111 family)
MRLYRIAPLAAAMALSMAPTASMQSASVTEAPTGFDNVTNGHTPQAKFDTNKAIFDEVEEIDDGLGPLYNQASCKACHSNPVSGGISQVTELRAGRFDGRSFIDHPGGSLINDQTIDASLAERILDGNNVRTFRTSLNILGDGFVEAIPNSRFADMRDRQPAAVRGTIINVPVVEAGGQLRVARFGWKNQHASLLSFAGDAYLNEMGITNLVNGRTNFARENTSNGNSVARADTVKDPEDDGDDVEAFADFMRSTKAPARGPITPSVVVGSVLFDQIGCAQCHVRSIPTAPPGTLINGGELTVSAALGNKVIHPFSDFMLHDVGTGDGIVQNGGQDTRNMMRTAPLWGVRTRTRLMHDGESGTFNDAILRHAGQAMGSANAYRALTAVQKQTLINFLASL